ncbi:uncharacterized protein Hap1MRO34_001249 isoform 2-T2 [Clarias gariepinus]|uniref:uncharacterized protein LOC128513937 isoform X2 n=1 Tax=Clarias gariepinus TaxID=13013 RepID=UPI00234C28D9|nr:uncharacterized protein LOC128513937 isoform X2 [Clarias gariepinus]
MNPSSGRDRSFLSADEASVVEAAVRTAVRSILQVFCEVNEKRSHCYEAKLAEAERENAALRFQLNAAELELQTLRQISDNYTISAEVTFSAEEKTGHEPAALENSSESAAVLELKEEEAFYPGEVFIKSEVTEEYPAGNCEYHVNESATHETYSSPHNHHGYQDPASAGSERILGTVPPLDKIPPFETPCNITSADVTSSVHYHGRLTRYENVRRYRERIRADPEKYLAWKEKNHLRYLQHRKTINELPEPMKNLQRKAWREATRRHRAKKLAQAALSSTSIPQPPSL